jgi:membrane fusion protein, copper/silver efflux system
MKSLFTFVIVAALAATGGWYASQYFVSHAGSNESSKERHVQFYQSPMHPWVKSDKPGQCTVCGMNLVPIYEGTKAFNTMESDLVMLPQGSPNVVGVETQVVKIQPLIRNLHVSGIIEDDDSKHRILSATVEGRIDQLLVNFDGAEVVTGQPLASFFSRTLLAAAGEYKFSFKQGGTVQDAARNRLIQFGLTGQQISKISERREDDQHFELLAPMTGTVVKRYVYAGQYVAEGEKLFELADFATMWFQFIAYEQDLPFLHVGQQVEISTASLPGKTFPAKIKFINPNLDDMTRSARIRVEIDNTDRLVKHKLYAQASVQTEAPQVLALPRTAVLWPGKSPRVYVEKEKGVYQQRPIKLGRAGDDLWEVLDGLEAGERVVTGGNMLVDGQAQLNNNTPEAGSAYPATTTKTMQP